MMNAALALVLLATATAGLNAAQKDDNAMIKMADGSYVVNTTTLAKDVKGYRGTTPLKITIKKDKVEKIEALKNTITEYMKENGSNKLTCGQYIATITEITKTSIDEKALRENLPDVAKQYEKSTTYDRFTVK